MRVFEGCHAYQCFLRYFRLKVDSHQTQFFPVHFYSESRKLPPEINFDFSHPRYLVTTLPESEFEGQEQDISFWHKYLVPVPFNF